MADFETDTLALKKKIGRIAASDNIDYTGTPNDPSNQDGTIAPTPTSYFDRTPVQNRTIVGSIKAMLGMDSPATPAQPVAVAKPVATVSTVTGSTTQPTISDQSAQPNSPTHRRRQATTPRRAAVSGAGQAYITGRCICRK